MSRLDLPQYRWFVSRHEGRLVTNAYTGLLGTLPDRGCIRTRTFNYRVYMDIASGNESDFRLIVESCIIQPWSLGGRKTDFERAEFEGTEHGVFAERKIPTKLTEGYVLCLQHSNYVYIDLDKGTRNE